MSEDELKTIRVNQTFPEVDPLEHWIQKMFHKKQYPVAR